MNRVINSSSELEIGQCILRSVKYTGRAGKCQCVLMRRDMRLESRAAHGHSYIAAIRSSDVDTARRVGGVARDRTGG